MIWNKIKIVRLMPVAVFLFGFGLYLFSSAPALAPYRDMGEMVAVSHTLGVAHPPGYPTYALIGKISTLIPFANQSYRVNLVSVFAGAMAGLLFYLVLVELKVSVAAAFLTILLWFAASGVWIIFIVTEMYSLNLTAALLILYLWISGQKEVLESRSVYLVSFLTGVLMGFRLDLVLLLPAFILAFLLLFWRSAQKKTLARLLGMASLFFTLGFSVYVYLPVRSVQKPLLNWNRPDNIEKFISSITRKTHGGTLDLLSKSYAPGELFWTDLKIYLADASRQHRWVILPLAVYGALLLFKKNRPIFVLIFLSWLMSGPFFIYKANMPPNPHALAVLEPYFLLPNIFLVILAALGFENILSYSPRRILLAGAALLVMVNIGLRWREVSKRNNFFGYDYGKNVLRTLPRGSILVMQKDVQLFTFWALQYAEGMRKDVAVVARGLAGSPWYIQMRSEDGLPVKLSALRSPEDFEIFIKANRNRKMYVGWDEDVPVSPGYFQVPFGLVRWVAPPEDAGKVPFAKIPDFLRDFYVYRGTYRYQSQNEFFSSDIIDDYNKAHFARGVEFSKWPETEKEALREWDHCVILNSESAAPYYRRGFIFFQKNDLVPAVKNFLMAEKLNEKTFLLTQKYHSLPDVVRGVQSEWADNLITLGVAFEKLGEKERSEAAYLKSLDISPNSSRAHYNLAVLYWNRDWKKVLFHLQEVLRVDPGNREARAFLPKAVYALQMSGQK